MWVWVLQEGDSESWRKERSTEDCTELTLNFSLLEISICLGWGMNLGESSQCSEISLFSADFFLQEEKWHPLQLIHNRVW